MPYRLDIFASPAQGNVFVDGSHEPAGNLVAGRSTALTETGDAIEGRLESEVFGFCHPSKRSDASAGLILPIKRCAAPGLRSKPQGLRLA